MSQQTSISRKASKNSPKASPKNSPNQRKAYNSPKRAQIEPSKLLYAPRPFTRQDSSKTVHKPKFNTAVKSQVPPVNKKQGYTYIRFAFHNYTWPKKYTSPSNIQS